jgi:hypothetical protein
MADCCDSFGFADSYVELRATKTAIGATASACKPSV